MGSRTPDCLGRMPLLFCEWIRGSRNAAVDPTIHNVLNVPGMGSHSAERSAGVPTDASPARQVHRTPNQRIRLSRCCCRLEFPRCVNLFSKPRAPMRPWDSLWSVQFSRTAPEVRGAPPLAKRHDYGANATSATDKAIPLNPECCRPEIRRSESSNQPYLTILPSSGRASLELKEVWQYRELLYFLIWRDIKLRYKQTALGAIWAIIQPLLPMLIFTLFFGRLAHVPSNGISYSLFAYAGLLPWTYFSNAVSNSSSSVVGNANLVTKVYFPRMLIPLSGVLAALVDFFIASVILIAMMIWYRVPLYVSQLWAPLILLAITLLAAGTGMLFAALNVRFRDVRFVLPFFVQFWMFATPVIYPASLIPAKWRWLLALNPMAGMIEGFRAALFGTALEWQMLAISTLAATLLLVYSAYFFRRAERTFADVI